MVHADSTNFAGLSKTDSYEMLLVQLESLLVKSWVANLANAASLLWHHFHEQPQPQASVNWAGFYVLDRGSGELSLGPFQGKAACQTIEFGRGVCGAAAQSQATQLVTNVHEFPGHIACDGDTNSEIVVPIIDPTSHKTLGVIDIDCTELNGFDSEDQRYLERLAALLAESLTQVL